VDEDSRPVTSAEVFWNGQFAGATNAEGRLALPALAVGDQLVARWRVLEQASPKKNHMHQSGQNWAYRLYITSMEIPGTGIPVPFTVANLDAPQVLTVRRSNTLIGFNIVASVEWDADEQYLGELEDGMLRASAYLYHASNGQNAF
jgi:hypothetical protein